jgi:delta1-piperideine-2-carboxylate reductase
MKIDITAATALVTGGLTSLGYTPAESALIAGHLMDCELRGLGFSGLARVVSIAERHHATSQARTPIAVLRETPVSARLHGGDNVGYLVAERATDMAIDKAKASGIAIIGASDTWYTGMLSYYAERIVAEDLVTLIASNASPWVAPEGGAEGRYGTNPICFGFPSADEPVIWDIGTSAIIHAQVIEALRLGRPLPEGLAINAAGELTTDPASALAGAFMPWGGHRGSGLGLVVQMLGMLSGSPMMPGQLQDFGFLVIAIRPDLLVDTETFKQQIADYAASVRSTRPLAGGASVRMPFDRSRADRATRLAEGFIHVPPAIIAALEDLQKDSRP